MSAATSPSSRAQPTSPARPRSAWQVAADLFDPPPDPYATDPVAYARDQLGFHAWSKQAEIMQAVRDHPRVAVRSSHGPGKTATAAQIVLWFLRTHRDSRVITTAPTWAQVEQLLWREIRASVSRAHEHGHAAEFPKPSATKLELGDQWFAIGLSTNEPERFQGHHAEFLLLVVDEASGVDEAIFEAAEGFLTAEGAHLLLVGNPTKIGGQFHRAFTTERGTWHTIHISTLDTPNYTGEPVPPDIARKLPRKGWAEEKAKAWGVDSPMYQVRVLGNFPSEGVNTVVPLHLVEAAQARDLPPARTGSEFDAVIAVDVARFGTDETVIATRHHDQVRIRETYAGKPTTHTAGRVIAWWHVLRNEAGSHPLVVVDDPGVGGGVTDILRESDLNLNVVAFNGGARAIQPRKYHDRRSELWFTMRYRAPELDLDTDEQLAADLTSPTYKVGSDNRLRVESKDETKKRLGRSPDRGDAALLTLVQEPTVGLPEPDPHRRQLVNGRPHAPDHVREDLGDYEAPRPQSESLTGDLLNDPM